MMQTWASDGWVRIEYPMNKSQEERSTASGSPAFARKLAAELLEAADKAEQQPKGADK